MRNMSQSAVLEKYGVDLRKTHGDRKSSRLFAVYKSSNTLVRVLRRGKEFSSVQDDPLDLNQNPTKVSNSSLGDWFYVGSLRGSGYQDQPLSLDEICELTNLYIVPTEDSHESSKNSLNNQVLTLDEIESLLQKV